MHIVDGTKIIGIVLVLSFMGISVIGCKEYKVSKQLSQFSREIICIPKDLQKIDNQMQTEAEDVGNLPVFVFYHDSLACSYCQLSYLPALTCLYELSDSLGTFKVMSIFSPRKEEYDWLVNALMYSDFERKSMELFYSQDIAGNMVRLDAEESGHCVRVLRHRAGDEISVIDGLGTLFRCRLTAADPKEAEAEILEKVPGFGAVPYRLTMAVCPTKNIDRFEWFAEKATEFGVDAIVPTIGDRSERKVLKPERMQRILLSAAKQSLKARIPELREAVSVREFLAGQGDDDASLKLICCCFEPEGGRKTVMEAIRAVAHGTPVTVLIGPEGDFSDDEVALAMESGWIPVSLGESRLRTETAALAAVAAVYFASMDNWNLTI